MDHGQVVDHWWWRPGWRTGRHLYACHFTFTDQPELSALAARYQAALREIDGLDPIPARWLHLSTQEVGFVDECAPERLGPLTAALAERLAALPAPVVTFHRPVVRPEAVYLPAEPSAPLRAVRAAIRSAIRAVGVGGTVLDGQPDSADSAALTDFRPHVSVVYCNASGPAAPLVAALDRLDVSPVTVTLRHIDLLEYHRDRRMYEWVAATPLAIGAAGND